MKFNNDDFAKYLKPWTTFVNNYKDSSDGNHSV